jgi:hypothetical protein
MRNITGKYDTAKQAFAMLVYTLVSVLILCYAVGSVSSCRTPQDAAANAIVASAGVVEVLHDLNVKSIHKASEELANRSSTTEEYDEGLKLVEKAVMEREAAIDALANALTDAARIVDESREGNTTPLPAVSVAVNGLRAIVMILSKDYGIIPPLPVPKLVTTSIDALSLILTQQAAAERDR